jgi:hypothetical protein
LPQPHRIDGERAQVLLRFDYEAALALLGELAREVGVATLLGIKCRSKMTADALVGMRE